MMAFILCSINSGGLVRVCNLPGERGLEGKRAAPKLRPPQKICSKLHFLEGKTLLFVLLINQLLEKHKIVDIDE